MRLPYYPISLPAALPPALIGARAINRAETWKTLYWRVGSRRMHLIMIVALGLVVATTTVVHPEPSAATPDSLESVPLFSRLSADSGNMRSYAAPLTLDVSLHRFFFTFHFQLKGNVQYHAPDSVKFTVERVPQQYQHLFDELGTPLTWTRIYDMHVLSAAMVDGRQTYTVEGVPRNPSQVDHMVIETSDASQPIHAQWFLHDGWTVTSTIEEQDTQNHLVPKHELSDIVGHGYKIHTDMQYGDYAMDSE